MENVKAVFLDRDGVVNKVILKEGKPFSPRSFEEFELFIGIKGTLEKFKKMGFINIIITNQPDIRRGLMDWEQLNKMHKLIKERLAIDDILVCPHDDRDNCKCRKPKPGMIFMAAKKWGIDLKASFMIGDSWKDIETGKAAGCTTILIDSPYNQCVKSDYKIKNLDEVVRII